MVQVLAADIGGTKTLLGIFESSSQGLVERRVTSFASREHDSFEALLATFLADRSGARFDAACFAVAGPVIEGASRVTNLSWRLDEASLADATRTSRVRLLNDVQAAALAVLRLPEDSQAVIHAGDAPRRRGNAVLIAAGTGLGEAILHWDGSRHSAIATEGGHADFAPSTDEEIELLRFLRAKHGGHVSWERVVSGPGLVEIYDFLRHARGVPPAEQPWGGAASGDAAASITQAALAGDDADCVAALDMFVRLYGSEAGNMALKCFALGGVYLGGGIAPRIVPWLRRGAFMEGFTAKGRFGELLSGIRVTVCLESRVALLGAARAAVELAAPRAPAGGGG